MLRTTAERWTVPLLAASAAWLIAGAAILLLGPHRPLESDAPFFLSIAENLAHHHRFVNDLSPWVNVPATDRMPLWPFFVSLLLSLLPGLEPNLVLRLSGVVLHGVTAAGVAWLTARFTGSRRAALLGGLAYAVYPPAIFLIDQGMSEPLFVCVLLIALAAFVSRRFYWTALLLGLSCLVRPNFLLMPALLLPAFLLYARSRAVLAVPAMALVGCLALFVAPTSGWIVRNYLVTGHMVVSTLQGITLYGSNNPAVAESLDYWGYWVQPDEIRGAPPRRTLARSMSPYELDRYYTTQAKTYLRGAWFSFPRLALGKLVRAYVPLPWNPSWGGYAAALCRLLLYLAVILTARSWIASIGPGFSVIILAMLLLSVVTSVVYYGTARFTFMLEVPLLPCAIAGIYDRLARRSTASPAREPRELAASAR